MPLPKENKYTYANYVKWSEEDRLEIIDGTTYMQAAPSWQHQSISLELSRQFANYLKDKECKVFAAPFDVCIPKYNENDDDIETVVQPDIVIVCDKSKIRKTGFFGAPSLIIEITSSSTTRNDKVFKFNKYEAAGVKEYWLVEPEGKFISVFILQKNKRYGRPEIYTDETSIKPSIFDDLEIDLTSVFNL